MPYDYLTLALRTVEKNCLGLKSGRPIIVCGRVDDVLYWSAVGASPHSDSVGSNWRSVHCPARSRFRTVLRWCWHLVRSARLLEVNGVVWPRPLTHCVE